MILLFVSRSAQKAIFTKFVVKVAHGPLKKLLDFMVIRMALR